MEPHIHQSLSLALYIVHLTVTLSGSDIFQIEKTEAWRLNYLSKATQPNKQKSRMQTLIKVTTPNHKVFKFTGKDGKKKNM